MEVKKTVVLGASPNPTRYSNRATRRLLSHNIPVVPLGIRKGSIEGVEIVRGKPDYDNIHTVTMYIGPAKQKEYYDYILALKPERIIFNPGTENPEFMKLAAKEGIEVLENCTLIMVDSDTF